MNLNGDKNGPFKVQIIPYPNNGGPKPDGSAPRVESGAIQFGNDWPGLFLRGDNALEVAMTIDQIGAFLNAIPDKLKVECGGVGLAMAFMRLKSLRDTIMTDVVKRNRKNEDGN
jgi:hypothetical protein